MGGHRKALAGDWGTGGEEDSRLVFQGVGDNVSQFAELVATTQAVLMIFTLQEERNAELTAYVRPGFERCLAPAEVHRFGKTESI
jgi:hypothetical protein